MSKFVEFTWGEHKLSIKAKKILRFYGDGSKTWILLKKSSYYVNESYDVVKERMKKPFGPKPMM